MTEWDAKYRALIEEARKSVPPWAWEAFLTWFQKQAIADGVPEELVAEIVEDCLK